MKILLLGIDGYIGYPLALDLLSKGHEVVGLDNHARRARAKESLTPIASPSDREQYLRKFDGYGGSAMMTLGRTDPSYIRRLLNEEKPEAIIHLAEQPSAPWSMIDPYHADITQFENVLGTLHLLWCMKEECPEAHLVKLGTMGEYGTPECDIPEGRIPNKPCEWTNDIPREFIDGIVRLEKTCPMKGLLFPRSPNSFYHASKVMDTINIEFACRNWGLRSTDIMQGIVYGIVSTKREELTRFDYDEHFGTCINRFVAQALIGHPLTVYGEGNQTRGWLPLKDSIQCINLILNSPPPNGQYRTINQFEERYSINELANIVAECASVIPDLPTSCIDHIPNPRNEMEKHYYNPSNDTLFKLGYVPTINIYQEIVQLLNDLKPYKDCINKNLILPRTKWS